MNKFKFRSEKDETLWRFLAEFSRLREPSEVIYVRAINYLPDKANVSTVEVETSLSIERVRAFMLTVANVGPMVETLATPDQYTGERSFIQYADDGKPAI